MAGERGGSFAGARLLGTGTRRRLHVLDEQRADVAGPAGIPAELAAGRVVSRGDHVGISGSRLHHRAESGGHIFAGGVFSWLVMMPAIKFFGSLPARHAALPEHDPDPNDARTISGELHPADGRGGGGRGRTDHVVRTMPTIISALTAGLKDVRAQQLANAPASSRIDRDLPMQGCGRLDASSWP